jgi:inhibitor of cysteine peptidase
MNGIIITLNDKGKTFTVVEGESIKIQLSENPTTGYRWEIKTLNANVIAFKDSNFSTDLGTGVGGGGTRTFNFNIRSSGTSKISLRLRREWEPENLKIDQFEVLIQATKKGD